MTASRRYAGVPVLVTGAQGFIGSWLAARLREDGATVIEPDRGDLDVTDASAVRRLIADNGVGTVFHLAAQSTVEHAYRDPFGTLDVNIRGTYSVLEACRTAPGTVERIVVASSYLAYGGQADGPPGVESELRGLFPYDVSKACADAISRSFAHTYGLPVAVLRVANVYGGGDFNYTRLVPETARALVRGERPVLRSDGTPQRDFLYVEDAVDAYLAVASSLDEPGARGRAWNAGAGEPVAVIDVVRRLIDVAGRDVEPLIQGEGTPPGELDRQAVDASALRDELGWRPRWDLDRGLTETYSWYRSELG